MEIQIDPHTLERAKERGANLDEIIDVLENGISILAKSGRLAKYKIFNFNSERNKKFYKEKRVEVYYIIEQNKIITVTVYVFYGKWEV